MRTLTVALGALTLTACAALQPVMIETDGAVGRTVERVLDRHDAYVAADESLEDSTAALAESALVRGLLELPEVAPSSLDGALSPVMVRHDVYVSDDASLDELEREVYLADTQRLRDLLEAAQAE